MVLVDILVPNEVMVSAILFIEVRLPMLSKRYCTNTSSAYKLVILHLCATSFKRTVLRIPSK